MTAALNLLEEEGLVALNSRSRAVVIADHVRVPQAPNWEHLLKHSYFINASITQSAPIPFINDVNPIDLTQRINNNWDSLSGIEYASEHYHRAIDHLIKGRYKDLYNKQGLPLLRELLCEHLKQYGIAATSDEVLIVSRRMQAYGMIGEVFFGPRVQVYQAQQYILNAYAISLSRHAKWLSLPSDAQGLNIDKMKTSSANRILIIQPTYSEPTGTMTTPSRRQEIYQFCSKHQIPIIEDAVLDNLFLDGVLPQPIKALDRSGVVIYIGGIHGPLTPGLSLDWIVAPAHVIRMLMNASEHNSIFPTEMNQVFLTEMLAHNALEGLLTLEKENMRQRREKYDQILNHHLGDIAKWHDTRPFSRIWLQLDDRINVHQLYHSAKRVTFHPGYIYGQSGSQHIQLYTSLNESDFERGIVALKKDIDEIFCL